MRNVALVVLAGVVCVLMFSLHSQSVQIEALQRNLNSANETAAAASRVGATASLELQAKCARQAEEQFKIDGWANDKLAGFTDHYNPILNKCFIEIGNSDVTKGVISMNARTLSDAFEGKVYGSYLWTRPQGKKYWEASTECTVTLPSGEEKQCRSSEEFDELVEQYMQ